MKKVFFLTILLAVFGIVMAGCDAGLEIVGLEIRTYPERIVYIAGQDKALDLAGGTVRYLLRDSRAEGSYVPMSDSNITLAHNIDFNTPGVYVVTLTQHKGVCQFPVQVVDKEAFEGILGSTR